MIDWELYIMNVKVMNIDDKEITKLGSHFTR
jgi:hypothetical protein